MAQLHLIEGPVGAGKSTFARALGREHGAACLILDDWFARLYLQDRPAVGVFEWYGERKTRCIEQIWTLSCELLSVDTSVVLELGLIERDQRERFYARVDEAGIALQVYMLDAAREVRRQRVQQRNRDQGQTFAMVVPDHIFEMASDMWQAPDAPECARRDIRFIRT